MGKKLKFLKSLHEITVDENNPYYSSEDGVLYDKEKKTLICIPKEKEGLFTLPDSVMNINHDAFNGCLVTGINVSENNPYFSCMGGILFDKEKKKLIRCFTKDIENYTIPNGVISIGEIAFSGCKSLTSITLPESLTSIGDGVFAGCKSLTSITLPESLTSIGNGAFIGCSSLTSINIPNELESIGEFSFEGCTSLSSITLPVGIKDIGKDAFVNCDNLIIYGPGHRINEKPHYAEEYAKKHRILYISTEN